MTPAPPQDAALVGLVLVSHSAALAEGLRELAAQMAPDVPIATAGGTDDGGLGTSFDAVSAALAAAQRGAGVVVLYDLGSARMTSELALEVLDEDEQERVRLVDAPLVEGALTAATAAAGGADLAAVVAALADLRPAPDTGADTGADTGSAPAAAAGGAHVREVVLRNALGLHARPGAQVVGALRGLDAQVLVRRAGDGAAGESASARSLVALLRLAARGGSTLQLSATGPDAEAALDRLQELVEAGFGELEDDRAGSPVVGADPAPPGATAATPARSAPSADGDLPGRPASPGRAVGPAAHLAVPAPQVPDVPGAGVGAERAALDAARARVDADLAAAAAGGGGDVFTAHRTLLADPELLDAAQGAVATGATAAAAWWRAVEQVRDELLASGEEVVAGRAADVADVGRRVVGVLLGESPSVTAPPGCVLLAEDLEPSLVAVLVEAGVVGIGLARGTPTSHAALLARAAGLPLVVGLGPAALDVADGTELLLDGTAGRLRRTPSEQDRRDVEQESVVAADRQAAERAAATAPVRLADGSQVLVVANVSGADEARLAVECGADGIGLLRTEFLFLDRPDLPGEQEQADALRAVLDVMAGRHVVVRTLDAGGDKRLPGLGLDPARHGFLGSRGLRLSLARPEVFATQLRAVLRAGAGHRYSLMFPMVTVPEEVEQAREALERAARGLASARVPYALPEQVGIMVEVPAAALTVDAFLGVCDFFSIGSNDLVQYTMAADRTDPDVADLHRPGSTAVRRLLAQVCDAAVPAGRLVAVCGEAASDPATAVELVRLGVRELSVTPRAVPAVKAALRAAESGAAGQPGSTSV